MRARFAAARAALLLLAGTVASAMLPPPVSAHGFAGFEVSGTQMVAPAGQANSTYGLYNHGEAGWRFDISFSTSAAGGNATRPSVLLQVSHLGKVVKEYRGVAGAITVFTEDDLDYYVNWTNLDNARVELRFRVALIGPDTPLELWVILACGVAVLTATVLVLVIDGMHAVGRGEPADHSGYSKASEIARRIKEQGPADGTDAGDSPAGPPATDPREGSG
jgi:hypothetical protein